MFHLIDKRKEAIFPGYDKEIQQLIRKLQDGIYERCLLPSWQLCLNMACAEHRREKMFNGFQHEVTKRLEKGKDRPSTSGADVKGSI